MSFAENINRICLERGTTLTALIKTVKGSSSFVTSINNGSLPKEKEMVEMARLLKCSVSDFFAAEGIPTTDNIALDEDEGDLLRVYRSLSRRQKHEFMSIAYDFESKAQLSRDKGSSAV